MRGRRWLLASLCALLAAGLACGKYGPPERIPRGASAATSQQPAGDAAAAPDGKDEQTEQQQEPSP